MTDTTNDVKIAQALQTLALREGFNASARVYQDGAMKKAELEIAGITGFNFKQVVEFRNRIEHLVSGNHVNACSYGRGSATVTIFNQISPGGQAALLHAAGLDQPEAPTVVIEDLTLAA